MNQHTSSLIASTEIGWYNPSANPPPFDMKLLLMMAGSRSQDAGRTWEPYTVVITGRVSTQGTGDDYDDTPAYDDWMAGPQTDYMDYQFILRDDDGEEIDDWYSDTIVAWAYYPLGAAQRAIDIERARQAAGGLANWEGRP